MELKKLIWSDVYKASKILKKLKVDVSEEDMNVKNPMIRGINIIKNMIGNSEHAQDEINEFLGHLFGISGEEFGNLSLKESFSAMKQIKESEDLDDFFTMLDGLMK